MRKDMSLCNVKNGNKVRAEEEEEEIKQGGCT